MRSAKGSRPTKCFACNSSGEVNDLFNTVYNFLKRTNNIEIDKQLIDEFRSNIISHLPKNNQKEIMRKLSNLSRYGFCKSHAFSYAQLVWKLAYMKANHPKEFWKATLNNNQSSYKKWVHIYEAKVAGVDINMDKIKNFLQANKYKMVKDYSSDMYFLKQ